MKYTRFICMLHRRCAKHVQRTATQTAEPCVDKHSPETPVSKYAHKRGADLSSDGAARRQARQEEAQQVEPVLDEGVLHDALHEGAERLHHRTQPPAMLQQPRRVPSERCHHHPCTPLPFSGLLQDSVCRESGQHKE